MKTRKKLISIVSPAFNEGSNIAPLAEEVVQVMRLLLPKYDYEYILVDDGSTDNTWAEIVAQTKKSKKIKGISLSRNFGQQIALTAGIDKARGEAVIYCDADRQQPPALFPKLIEKWEGGVEVVHTLRTDTQDKRLGKRIFSSGFYYLINLISEIPLNKGAADFKLLDKKVYTKLGQMRETNRFLRGMVPWIGFKSETVKYKARKRVAGRPLYNFQKNLIFAKIGILSLSTRPLVLIGLLGLVLIILSLSGIIGALIVMAIRADFRLISPVLMLVLFNTLLFGIVLTCLGIVGLYISFLHQEIIKRPLYFIARKANV